MQSKKVYFVSGIDTDAGKSVVTGLLARDMNARNERTITQKFIQTGNTGISEDIELHRRIMGIPLQEVDLDGTTCPIIFTYPSSPQLAAEIDHREIDLSLVEKSTAKLLESYDTVLLEGAGGLFVPLTDTYSTIDYITDHHLPLILVTSPRLGSINHTVLSLEACFNRHIEVAKLVYNQQRDYRRHPTLSQTISQAPLPEHRIYRDFAAGKKVVIATADLAQIQTLGYK